MDYAFLHPTFKVYNYSFEIAVNTFVQRREANFFKTSSRFIKEYNSFFHKKSVESLKFVNTMETLIKEKKKPETKKLISDFIDTKKKENVKSRAVNLLFSHHLLSQHLELIKPTVKEGKSEKKEIVNKR